MAKESTTTRGELIDKVVKIRRCAAVVKGGRRFSFAAMVVVGDTPLDIQCAKVAGARSVAVATGIFNEQLLQTQGADIVLKDLTDTEGFIDTLYQFDRVSS